MEPKGSEPTRRIHPLVSLDYRVRVPSYLILAVGLAASFYQHRAPLSVWLVMVAQVLAWPYVARAIALASRNTKRAELANLLADACFIGGWVAVTSFDPWLTTTYVIGATVAFMSVGGVRFSLLALAALCASSLATALLGGFRPGWQSSPLTMAIGMLCLLLYMSMFGLATNRQARRIVQSNRTIAQQKVEIERRTRELTRSLEEVRALAEVTAAISASLDHAQVLDTIVRRAVTLSGSDAGAIFEFDPAARSFAGIASHNLSAGFLEGIRATSIDPVGGVIRRASETGRPFQIPDVERATAYIFRTLTLQEGFRSMLAAPIPGRNTARGITVFRHASGRFDDRVVDLLVALGNQSRVAISNARLFQEVQSQRAQLLSLSEKLDKLYRLSTAMQEPLSLREQLHRVLAAATEMGIIERIYVWALRPAGDRLANLAGAGFSAEEWRGFEGVEIPLEDAGAMGVACLEGRSLLFNDEHPLTPELRLRPPYSEIQGVRTRAFLVVPMIARGRTVGVLTGDNKPSGRPILPETVELLATFASHAAVAVENSRLFQESTEKGRQLEIASRHKSQFLANMSHELRTPLNAILGYAELIQDAVYGEVPPRIAEVLERVSLSGRHLLALINDVLDLSKIEAGQLTLALGEYSMHEVVRGVLDTMASLAADKGLTLEVLAPPALPLGVGDERRITQVLMNLAGNALKFTEAGGVRIEVAVVESEQFQVSVTDTGPGIPASEHERIFEEFHQAEDTATRRKGGTGLGLAIARRIIEMHGGRIWVESRPGAGATFRFTVPVRADRIPAARGAVAEAV
jgi:signal transduction histidine kinase